MLTRKDFMGAHEWCFYGWKTGAAHQYFGPNNATDLWHVKKINPQSMVHLTEKPVELAVRAIEYSSRKGEQVLDLFGGSGSTLIACEQTGRRAFLMELDGKGAMAKSDKSTIVRRVQEVVRMLVAGAEFADIRQYAAQHGWRISDRQLKRYVQQAHRYFARSMKRERDALLGRHLMQRRALFARSIKANDRRIALDALRDEAQLEGLYPPSKIAPTTPDGKYPYPGPSSSPLNRRERLVRLLAAEQAADARERTLIEQVTPVRVYRLPDTMLPTLMLDVLALIYVSEQLEYSGQFLHAVWRLNVEEPPDEIWDVLALASAYRFGIGQEGWTQFTAEAGFDGAWLVQGNYYGCLLELCSENIPRFGVTREQVLQALHEAGLWGEADHEMVTPAGLARSWRRLFRRVCPEEGQCPKLKDPPMTPGYPISS